MIFAEKADSEMKGCRRLFYIPKKCC